MENIVLERHTNPDAASRNGKPPVYFYAPESDQPILDILKPSIVIVYGFFEPQSILERKCVKLIT